MRQSVLICLTGLSRTFKKTAPLLFERIIEPNKADFDFDIIINTDSKGNGLTYGRPDTMCTGISVFQPNTEEELINELSRTYNIHKSSVTTYCFNESVPVMAGFLAIKRLILCLKAAEKRYDMYIFMRLDAVITKTIDLSKYRNTLVLCTSNGVRSSFFHNRDVLDTPIIGTHDAFMKWIFTYSLCGKTILSVFSELENFMPTDFMDRYLENDYLDEWLALSVDVESYAKDLGLVHSSDPWVDHIIINNSIQKIEIMGVYGPDAADNLRNNLIRALAIINRKSAIILGEHIGIHSEVIRL